MLRWSSGATAVEADSRASMFLVRYELQYSNKMVFFTLTCSFQWYYHITVPPPYLAHVVAQHERGLSSQGGRQKQTINQSGFELI